MDFFQCIYGRIEKIGQENRNENRDHNAGAQITETEYHAGSHDFLAGRAGDAIFCDAVRHVFSQLCTEASYYNHVVARNARGSWKDVSSADVLAIFIFGNDAGNEGAMHPWWAFAE